MLDERALRNPFSRRFIALMGALVLAATGGFLAAAPAHADDDGPIYWEWTDAPYWEPHSRQDCPRSNTGSLVQPAAGTVRPASAQSPMARPRRRLW